MTPAATQLVKGAVKSAMAALGGTALAGQVLDPAKLSVMTLPGLLATLKFTAIVVVIAEARYGYQWLTKWSDS